jgi:ubiquinone/menaquinone biosynthesis C-methylase UbiE
MEKLNVKIAAEFYNKIIKLHHQEFNYKWLQYRDWLDILTSELDKGDVVLDLGCGNGRAIKYFVDRGFQGIGVDISDKMLELARKYVCKAKFYKKDFTKIEFKPNSFDAVISFFALNHIPKSQFKKVVGLCKRVLKRGGFLLLGMVKGESEGLFEGFYGKKLPLYGAAYTKKELNGILRSSGYSVLKMEIEHFKGKYFEEDDIYILAKVKK